MSKRRQADRALALIAACRQGITDGALEVVHGCAAEEIAGLLARGLIHGIKQVHSHPKGLVVVRYWVTAAGLQQLSNGGGGA